MPSCARCLPPALARLPPSPRVRQNAWRLGGSNPPRRLGELGGSTRRGDVMNHEPEWERVGERPLFWPGGLAYGRRSARGDAVLRFLVVGHLDDVHLVEGEPDDGAVPAQQLLALEEVIDPHPLTGGGLALGLLPGDAGHDQDALARLEQE